MGKEMGNATCTYNGILCAYTAYTDLNKRNYYNSNYHTKIFISAGCFFLLIKYPCWPRKGTYPYCVSIRLYTNKTTIPIKRINIISFFLLFCFGNNVSVPLTQERYVLVILKSIHDNSTCNAYGDALLLLKVPFLEVHDLSWGWNPTTTSTLGVDAV